MVNYKATQAEWLYITGDEDKGILKTQGDLQLSQVALARVAHAALLFAEIPRCSSGRPSALQKAGYREAKWALL